MYKNSTILNYFRPFTQPLRMNKRSLPEDDLEEPREIRRSRSTTPKKSQHERSSDEERDHLGKGLQSIASTVARRSSSRQPPSPQQNEPRDNASPVRVYSEETSCIPPTPSLNNPNSPDAEVLGSQGTCLMRSQRVVKNGEVVIRNSDDESDSDTTLEDLSDLLLPRGQKPRGEQFFPGAQSPAQPVNGNSEDGRRLSSRRRTNADKKSAPPHSTVPVQPKKYKFDLESLTKQKKQEDASDQDIVLANKMLRSFEQQEASASGDAGAAPTERPFDATFIDIVMKEHGDEDEISRLKAAIQRTEALHQGKSWSFFDEQTVEPPSERSDFPVVEDDRLERVLGKTSSSRQQAFLSGYVGELAMKNRLPEEILLWMMDAICVESRDDLRYSYTATLIDASKQLASVLSPERIDMLFRKVGATAAALDVEDPVTPRPAVSRSTEAVSRPSLLSILEMFKHSASDLNAESRIHLTCTLCRLALDDSLTNSCRITIAMEDAFASLIESIPEQDLDHEVGDQTDKSSTKLTKFRTAPDGHDFGLHVHYGRVFAFATSQKHTRLFPSTDLISPTSCVCMLFPRHWVFDPASK